MTMRSIWLTAFLLLAPAVSAQDAPPGALACTGCHANSSDAAYPIRQLGAERIAAAMIAYKSGEREASLMDRIAAGFTDEEIAAIAAWFASQEAEP